MAPICELLAASRSVCRRWDAALILCRSCAGAEQMRSALCRTSAALLPLKSLAAFRRTVTYCSSTVNVSWPLEQRLTILNCPVTANEVRQTDPAQSATSRSIFCCPRSSPYVRLQERNRMYLVMEYCSGGDLAHYIRRCKRLQEATAHGLMVQLAAGLREMWAHNLVHVRVCDLTCSSSNSLGLAALQDIPCGSNTCVSRTQYSAEHKSARSPAVFCCATAYSEMHCRDRLKKAHITS